MKDYQERVFKEHRELNEKMKKLSLYLEGQKQPGAKDSHDVVLDRLLLMLRLGAMKQYSTILGHRIATWEV